MSVSSIQGGASSDAGAAPADQCRAGGGLEVAEREAGVPRRDEVNDLARLANYLAKSGFFRDALAGYQAFAKLLFARDLGLSATAALTGIHIVEGKPELSANIQAQMVRCYLGVGGERYDYRVISSKDERHERCEIEFYRIVDGRRETLGSSEFTIKDAERAGLTRPTRSGQPSNYAKFPPNMLFARAMSNGVAFHCPEVTRGIRVYHEGEIEPAPTALPADVEVEMIPEAQAVGEDAGGAAPQDGSEAVVPEDSDVGGETFGAGVVSAQAEPEDGGNGVVTVDIGDVGPAAPDAA